MCVNTRLQLTACGVGPPGVSQAGVGQAAGLGVRLQEVAAEAVHGGVHAQGVGAGRGVGLWVDGAVATGEGGVSLQQGAAAVERHIRRAGSVAFPFPPPDGRVCSEQQFH